MTPLVNISELTKSHGARSVLAGVSLTLQGSEIIGLVGENGAGKSTLGSILVGVYPPDGGEITLFGQPYLPTSPEEASRIGVGWIKQRIEIAPELTVAQAIFRGTYQADRPHAELRRQATWILNDISIDLNPDDLMRDLARPQYGLVEAARSP